MTAALLALGLATVAAPADDFERGVAVRHDARTARDAFARAAAGYDRAWDQSPSPSLAVARGRAHFLAGDLPRSLAAVHAGLSMAPYDAELQGDLKTLRGTIRYPEPADPALRVRPSDLAGVRFRLSPWDAFLAGSAFGALAVIGGVLAFMTRARGALAAAVGGVVGFGLSAGLAWTVAGDRPEPVAILTADTVLRRGNGVSYPPRLTEPLPRGAEVRPVGARGGWLRVELPGGAVGWIPEANVLK